MSPSHAKPDLATPVNMSLLHAKDTGYRFVQHTFRQPTPELISASTAHAQATAIQAYAKPRHYQVWMAIPEHKTGHQPFKNSVKNPVEVLYMLDGNAAIADLNSDTLLSLSESDPAPVLVFIGYQNPYRFDVDARAYDYTPPSLLSKTGIKEAFQEDGRERLNGGAEHFYKLIEQEIKPWVYQQLGEKPEQEALWGHSYGGLFVLYNLFQHPEAYQKYFSADPSLWWHGGEMVKYWLAYQNLPESQLSAQSQAKKLRLTFSQSLKQTATPAVAPIRPNEHDFARQLCTHFKKNCSYQFYNQSHGELFKTSLLDSLTSFEN